MTYDISPLMAITLVEQYPMYLAHFYLLVRQYIMSLNQTSSVYLKDNHILTFLIPNSFLERAYLNFNDFNGAMPPSLCTLREDGALKDLWSDCGGYPITCTCCTVCCDMVAECNEMESQRGGYV